MESFIWLVILYGLLYIPIGGYMDFKKLENDVKTNEQARIKFYKSTIIEAWLPILLIIFMIFYTPISFKDVMWGLPTFQTDRFGFWGSLIIALFTAYLLIHTLVLVIGYYTSKKIRDKFSQQKKEQYEKSGLDFMLPITKKEKRLWNGVAITAGVTEEILYRGFFVFGFSYLFPEEPIWIYLLLSSLVFGFGHIYQGFLTGFVRTTVVGFLFAMSVVVFHSLIPIIVLHILVNYMAKLDGSEETTNGE